MPTEAGSRNTQDHRIRGILGIFTNSLRAATVDFAAVSPLRPNVDVRGTSPRVGVNSCPCPPIRVRARQSSIGFLVLSNFCMSICTSEQEEVMQSHLRRRRL